MDTIHMDNSHPLTKQIGAAIGYHGRKFRARGTTAIEIHGSACAWSGARI